MVKASSQTVRVWQSWHPLADVRIVGEAFNANSRARITVLPQPGRVLFVNADVTFIQCEFDGFGMVSDAGGPLAHVFEFTSDV